MSLEPVIWRRGQYVHHSVCSPTRGHFGGVRLSLNVSRGEFSFKGKAFGNMHEGMGFRGMDLWIDRAV